jgi:NAD(P)-dependent dehydrogenase (short-subunit alcohol dehydrogenase family)
VALVSGAGRGIGRATAEAFGREGASVVLAARGAEEIRDLAAQIQAAGGRALPIQADINDPGSIERLIRQTVDAFGRLDALVTCAAAGPAAGPSEDLALASWRTVIDADLTGTFLTCQAAGRVMLGQRYGRIVNLSSFHVIGTYPQRAAYVAAKAGVVGLTQALAVEWGGRGITVNSVAPGPIRTKRTEWFLSQDPANEAGMIGRTPNGRIGEPSEVAALILFLCSTEAGHVNGQTITIDGGWTKNAWWGTHPFGR